MASTNIFPSQRSNLGLLHCRWILYHLGHQGKISANISHPIWMFISRTLVATEIWSGFYSYFTAEETDSAGVLAQLPARPWESLVQALSGYAFVPHV